jgi:ABC-2 type transport system permease protein
VNRAFTIAKKEFTHIFRDKRTLAQVVMMPLMMLVLFGYGVRFDVINISLAVWDQDHGPESRAFMEKVMASGKFLRTAEAHGYAELTRLLDDGTVRIAIVFPPEFSDRLHGGETVPLQLLVDGSESNTAGIALGYLNAIALNWNAGRIQLTPPIAFQERVWYNPELRSSYFIVPGIIAIILMMIGAMLTAQTITREKQRGTIEQLVVSPVGRYELIVGKLLPYVGVAFFDMLLVIVAGYLLFGVPIAGSFTLLLFMGALYLVGILGIGVFASSLAETQESAMLIVLLMSFLPSLMLSGFVFPIESMPVVVQGISHLVPARFFLVIIRAIYLKGVGIGVLWPQALYLVAFDVFMIWVAARRFEKRLG